MKIYALQSKNCRLCFKNYDREKENKIPIRLKITVKPKNLRSKNPRACVRVRMYVRAYARAYECWQIAIGTQDHDQHTNGTQDHWKESDYKDKICLYYKCDCKK